jgi:hypothetical protein
MTEEQYLHWYALQKREYNAETRRALRIREEEQTAT